MLGDARCDSRMRELEQQGTWTGAKQQDGFPIQSPGLRSRAEHPGVARARIHERTIARDRLASPSEDAVVERWGTRFDPDQMAQLETRMWKAYYRRQPARLFGLLVLALRAQARVSLPRALAASLLLTKAAAGFARARGDYERFAPEIGRAYRLLGLPADVDAEEVARHELRWWVVRREIGLAAGTAAGDAITGLYAAVYGVPPERVAEAARLRGLAAEVRDRGAAEDPDGPLGSGLDYWPEVAHLLRTSYRRLRKDLDATALDATAE